MPVSTKEAEEFIETFADYLGSSERLPFVSRQYEVLKPKESLRSTQDHIDSNTAVEFKLKLDGIIFGHFKVTPHKYARHYEYEVARHDDGFVIVGINSGYEGTPFFETKEGIGRELVRRAVLYAYDGGYQEVNTTVFTHAGSSFWYGLGFHSHEPDEPKWERIKDAPKEIEFWQHELEQDPNSIWNLARTEIGQRVLFNTGYCGVLDLREAVQRDYAFNRLKLNHILNSSPS